MIGRDTLAMIAMHQQAERDVLRTRSTVDLEADAWWARAWLSICVDVEDVERLTKVVEIVERELAARRVAEAPT